MGKPEPEAKICSSTQRGVISRVESQKISEPIGEKLQPRTVMEFPFHFSTTSDDAAGGYQTFTGGVIAAPHDMSGMRTLVLQDSPRGYRSRSVT
jgi:hypothetical protein